MSEEPKDIQGQGDKKEEACGEVGVDEEAPKLAETATTPQAPSKDTNDDDEDEMPPLERVGPPRQAKRNNDEDMPPLDTRNADGNADGSDDTLSIDSTESDLALSPDKDPTELIIKANTLKEEGNTHFKEGNLDKAVRSYRKGTNVIKPLNKNNTGDDQVKALYVSLQNNLSMCMWKQNKPKLSRDVATQALQVDPTNVKSLYRRAVAHRKMGYPERAKADLKEALKHDYNNTAVRKELISLKKEMENASEREKKQLQKAFSSKSGGSSFLYNDKEEEKRKQQEAAKKKKEEKEALLKQRKQEWEDECVNRMANQEEAISFEEWEKEQQEQEKLKEKQKKEEEKRQREELRRARAEAQKLAAAANVDEDSDDDDKLSASELATLRGYKKTSDGRTTSYFTRELSEEEQKILGNTTPQKLESAASASSSGPTPIISPASSTEAAGKGQASAWNQAGTWEEKNATEWCTSHLRSQLSSATACHSDTTVGVVTSVQDLSGEASVALIGGKKRYIFDFHATLLYEIRSDADDEMICSGKLRLPDICSTSHDELEVDALGWTKAPGQEKESDAMQCRTLLMDQVRVAVQQFVKDFNAHY